MKSKISIISLLSISSFFLVITIANSEPINPYGVRTVDSASIKTDPKNSNGKVINFKKIRECLEDDGKTIFCKNRPKCVADSKEDLPKRVENTCKGGWLQSASTVVGVASLGTQVATAGSGGSTSDIVKGLATANLTLSGVNGAIGTRCLWRISSCKRACKKRIKACEAVTNNSVTKEDRDLCDPKKESLRTEETVINGSTNFVTTGKEKIPDFIEKAKKISKECESHNDKAVQSLGQAAMNLAVAAVNREIKKAYDDESDEQNPELTAAPTTLDVGSGGEDFGYVFSNDDLGSSANLAGNDDDGRANLDNTALFQSDDNDGVPIANNFTGNTPDESSDSKTGNQSSPSSLALDSGSQNDEEKDKKAGLLGNSYKNGIGRFVGGSGGSSNAGYSGDKNGSLNDGRGFKIAENDRRSKSSSERHISTVAKKHRSIFEHMSTLIKSYCNEGNTNC